MKKLLFLILVLFTANVAFSQITTNVSLKCQVYASSGTAPTFNIQSLVSDELSKYDGSSVAAGDKLFIIDGSECYELHISSVTLGSGSVLNFVAYDSTGVLTTVPNGQAAVIRKYSIQQVPFIPSGLRDDLASCILQKIASTVNSITGGVDNCTKSITQISHGFTAGDVLYWDEAESEYVTFTGNYADASWPVYVVLDSLTDSTFVGVSCGIIDEDFSLPEGLYYATNTGLSLTPAAVEYPVLKVYDGKAQVLAFPGLEFDATGKELFDVVTVTGQRTVDGGDVLDLHADSVRVSITIADTVATDVGHALELLRNNSGGSGISGLTTNRVIKATSATTVGDGLLQDDGTLLSLDNGADTGKGFKFDNWTTENRPTNNAGVSGYNSTNGVWEFNNGSEYRQPAIAASLTGLGTATRIPYYNSSGKLTDDPILRVVASAAGPLSLVFGKSVSLTSNNNYYYLTGERYIGNGTAGTLTANVGTLYALAEYTGSQAFTNANAFFSNVIAGGGLSAASTIRSAKFDIGSNGSTASGHNLRGVSTTVSVGRGASSAYGTDVLVSFAHASETLTDGRGVNVTLSNGGAGTVTTMRGATISLNANAGTMTNTGGFHVGDITVGTQTNTPISYHAEDANTINVFNQPTNIGTNTAPVASAVLELSSVTKGFLPPRMTGVQVEAIASPAEGLMIYATDGSGVTITTKGWWGYDGVTWVKLN